MKTSAVPQKSKGRCGTGHVRKRTDGSWEGQYYFQDVRKSCYGKTEEECTGKLNVVLAKIFKGSYILESSLPLYCYLHYWHEHFVDVKPSTHKNYETYIESHIFNTKLGSTPLNKLCLEDFIDFFERKKNSGRLDYKSGGLSPKTLKNLRNFLNTALDFAVFNLRLLEYNPMKGIKTPKVPVPGIRVFSSSSQYRLKQAALTYPNKNALMVLIDLYTGLRCGELCALSWPDIFLEEEYFKISFTMERLYKKWAEQQQEYIKVPMNGEKPDSKTALYLGPPKTDSGKLKVYMSEQAIEGFESIKAYQIKAGLYQPDGFVFLQKNGNPYDPHAYNKLYRKIIHYAGVDYRKFHTLRHTFATRAFELSFDIPTLAEILGHAQKSTTENMYGHSTDETKRKSMARFNSRAI